MWKKVVPILLVLIVIAYSALWFSHAGKTEEQAKATLDALASGKGAAVTYDSLSVGGFPFEFVTHIKNPVVTVNATELQKALHPMQAELDQSANETVDLPSDVIRIDGEATIAVNYFTHSITFNVSGKSSGESHVAKTPITWKSNSEGMAGCSITLGPDADMSLLQESALALLKKPETIARNFKSMDCLADPMEVVNSETGEMLYRGGDQIFSIAFEQNAPGDVSANLALVSNDYEVGDAWNEWVNDLMEAVTPGGLNTGVLAIQSHEAVGKQNTEVKASYRGPGNIESLRENEEIKIEVTTFKVTNNLYEITMPMHFTLTKKASQFTGEAKINGKATYNPVIDEYVQKTTEQLAEALFADMGESPLREMRLATAQKEQMQKSIEALIPAFGTFKTASLIVDATFKGRENEQMHQQEGEVSLNAMEVRMGDYGFSGTGNAMLVPPRGEISLRCLRCHETVDKLVIYATELRNMIALMNPFMPEIPEGIAFRSAVSGFVESISTPAEDNPNDRLILFSSSGNRQYVISGKTFEEVVALAMQTFAPYFAPPAGQGLQ